MSKYDEVQALIESLNSESKRHLTEYLKNAPDWLYDSLQIVHYPSNYLFLSQGSEVRTVSILVKGIVKGTDYPILGAMYDFMWFDPIKAFGALEYFSKQKHFNASLMTASPCTMILLPIAVYSKWMQTDINAMYMDASTTTNQLLTEINRERIYIFMQGPDRLGYFFLLYYKQFEKEGICEITLTKQQISDCTGLSIRTVNRGISILLEKECLIKAGSNLIIQKQQFEKLGELFVDLLDSNKL